MSGSGRDVAGVGRDRSHAAGTGETGEVTTNRSDESTDDANDHRIEVTPTDSTGSDGSEFDERTVTVDRSDEPVDGPEFVLYGGKGGVGKTTMAAATALDSARRGHRTLVVSTDPAHSLGDVFDREVPSRPEPIHETLPLFGAEIDPDAGLAEAMGGVDSRGAREEERERGADGSRTGESDSNTDDSGDPSAGYPGDGQHSNASHSAAEESPFDTEGANPLGGFERLLGGGPGGLGGDGEGGSPMDALLGGSMPGADEVVALQVLIQYLDDDRFERVVVDTAPTGHTLRLLELPELMDTMTGRLLRLRERIGTMFDGISGLFGGGEDAPRGGDDLEALRDQIERLRATLSDPSRTDFRIVFVPEEMSVLEAKRLRTRLESYDIPVETVVVNRVMEPLADVTDDVDGDFLGPNLDDCAFCSRRWSVQQRALTEAQELFRGTNVRRVPLFADEVRGEEMLTVVAACLR